MNCKICNKSLKGHSTNDLYDCLRKDGIDVGDEKLTAVGAFAIAARAGKNIGMNVKHKTITVDGQTKASSDMARDIIEAMLQDNADTGEETKRRKRHKDDEEIVQEPQTGNYSGTFNPDSVPYVSDDVKKELGTDKPENKWPW